MKASESEARDYVLGAARTRIDEKRPSKIIYGLPSPITTIFLLAVADGRTVF